MPHFTERVRHAQGLLADHDRTPALTDADRQTLTDVLHRSSRAIDERGSAEQMLHGEPHPGNLLATHQGLQFIDFETCCRGPVEFDVAPRPRGGRRSLPGADPLLLRECRKLVLGIITTWRWDRDDQLPGGRRLGNEWLTELRAMLDSNARHLRS